MSATSDSDRIAREAARLFETGRAESVQDAIRAAAERLGAAGGGALRGPMPGPGRVRQHIRAMAMQEQGGEAYAASVRGIMGLAEEVMTLLESAFDDVHTMLAGRAAKGLIEGGAELHIRLYTRRPAPAIAAALVAQGYEEPVFETAETRFGRADRLRIVEDGVQIILTRCLPDWTAKAGRGLFSGRPIEVVDLDGLRKRIAELKVE
jgi:plasmid stabilization system protein ParE